MFLITCLEEHLMIFSMKKTDKLILPYLIPAIAILIILIGLFSGCDVIKCYPEFDINGEYIGIQCGGDF